MRAEANAEASAALVVAHCGRRGRAFAYTGARDGRVIDARPDPTWRPTTRMSERPNDAPDRPTEGTGAEPPIDEANRLEDGGAPRQDRTAEGAEADEAAERDEATEADEATEGAAAEAAERDEAAEAEARDEAAAMAAEADVQRERGLRPSERRALRAAERTQIPIDPSLRIKDRASSLFVILTLVAFGLILLNGLVLGKGGFLTSSPSPTAAPVPTLAPGASPTAGPGESPAATPSAAPSPALTPAPTPAPTATPAPTPGAS